MCRLRSHLATPSRKASRPKGRHIMATSSPIHPALVWGPWGPMPPKTKRVRSAAMMPAREVPPPVRRSWRVPSSKGSSFPGFSDVARWISRRARFSGSFSMARGLSVRGMGTSAAGGLHGVDDDAGERDVETDGEGPAGDALMGGEASGEREEEGDEDERQRDHREQDMRGQELPVKGPERIAARKFGLAVQGEVGEVGDQEDRRKDEGGQHGHAVLRNLAGADEVEAVEQRHG